MQVRAAACCNRRTDAQQSQRGAYVMFVREPSRTLQVLVSYETPKFNRADSVRELEVREQRRSESVQEADSGEDRQSDPHRHQESVDGTRRMSAASASWLGEQSVPGNLVIQRVDRLDSLLQTSEYNCARAWQSAQLQ
ncbi:Hypothetical predicted protein [Pelobates cultripes]|uniref:Uncharacterized protein n=1 Tax=Pelobates cultripes TaxID=61616 RepID=A0AAD1T968_PELCU|nr:Hypothetical predicted protein [Pelobates cultripes]